MSGRDTLYMGNEILYDPIYILIDLFIHVMDFVESGVKHHKPPVMDFHIFLVFILDQKNYEVKVSKNLLKKEMYLYFFPVCVARMYVSPLLHFK
jgi:hypothetical protein